MVGRLLGGLVSRLLDLAFWGPRKGSLIPREQDLEPVRTELTQRLATFADLTPRHCRCTDCLCLFNKNLEPLDGRGQE